MSTVLLNRALPCVLLSVACLGCGSKGWKYERYIPAPAAAERALESALDAWRDGQGPGEVPGTAPRVQVVDCYRRPGQRLQSFEVIGEVLGERGPRCFAVRLTLANPAEVQKVRYYVLGIDPLWVYRQEEYDMIAHWECFTPPTQASPSRSNARQQ